MTAPTGTTFQRGGQPANRPAYTAEIADQQSAPTNTSTESRFWTGIINKGFTADSSGNNVRKSSRVNYGSIADGSSNTVLFAEKAAPSALGYNGDWADFWGESYGSLGHGNFVSFRAAGPPIADNDRGTHFGNNNSSGGAQMPLAQDSIGSAHSGSCNISLADGSTHSISTDVNMQGIWDLADRSDGNVVNVLEL